MHLIIGKYLIVKNLCHETGDSMEVSWKPSKQNYLTTR